MLALYALTKVFFYIPMASLSGLIIHAVGDLLTPPATVYQFWQVSPIEVVLFFAGVLIMVFTDIETGVYFVVAASAALLLVRIAKAHGSFLGKVDVYYVPGNGSERDSPLSGSESTTKKREAFLPLSRRDGSNKNVNIRNPYPGVFVYRFSEGFNYANTAHYMDELVAYIQKHTRPVTTDRFEKIGVSQTIRLSHYIYFLLSSFIPFLPKKLRDNHRLTRHLGPPLEQPGSPPRQSQQRHRRPPGLPCSHTRLRIREQRGRDIHPRSHRHTDPTRLPYLPRSRRVARSRRQQPLDPAGLSGFGVWLPARVA